MECLLCCDGLFASFGARSGLYCPRRICLGWVDREDNLRPQRRNSVDGPGPDYEIARVRFAACLNADAESANACGIPERPFRLRKSVDKTTKRPYRRIRGSRVSRDLKMRAIFPPISPRVEHEHLPPEAPHKRLKIAR